MKQNNLSRHSGRRAGICGEVNPGISIDLVLNGFRVKPGMTDIVKPEMTEMNEIW